ncbi:hypothetical protein TNCV_1768191 [Trichonephila clavipes]|nr:hypothetical protein TNCV_1768191 [Trichonephila clavipes]
MSYDYAAWKRFFEHLFDLNALDKIEFLSSVSHHQSSGVSLWGEKGASKLLRCLVFHQYGAALERDTNS